MSRKYKLDVSRPDFMMRMIDKDVDQVDDNDLEKVLYLTSTLSYVVYTAMMEANLKKVQILEVSNDGEAIAIKLDSKSLAKEVADKCGSETVRFGHSYYEVHTKIRDKYVVFTMKELEDDDEDEDEEKE